MKLIAPDYYPDFACIAGACGHSCCVGWEIDIDEDTREYYRTVPDEMGARLAENIVDNGETSCFRLGEGERCPFLNGDNLCDLILTLGEGALCQICDDHPRFRNFFSDRTELGLGLCCEAAGRLILFRKEPMALINLEDSGENESLDSEEAELLSVRDALIALAQDRSLFIDARIDAVMARSGLELDVSPSRWANFLLDLERLDDAWAKRLESLKTAPAADLSPKWDAPFEQLLVYLLYRHLPGALEDNMLSARIACCALMTALLRRLFALNPTDDNLVELARLYSSEIEYSDENIEKILWEING